LFGNLIENQHWDNIKAGQEIKSLTIEPYSIHELMNLSHTLEIKQSLSFNPDDQTQ
jgi:hypothetical protein